MGLLWRTLVVASLAGVVTDATSSCQLPWSYRDIPAWDSLPMPQMCGHKTDQSPINIVKADVVHTDELGELELLTDNATLNDVHFVYDLKTWQVNVPIGSTGIIFQGKEFSLTQFHMHSPSENTIDGLHSAMEMHYVNVASDGQILVIAQFWQLGEPDPVLARVVAATEMPNPYVAMTPEDMSYYHFTGSLTTPPCTNNTKWVVMRQHRTLSSVQLQAYRGAINAPACNMLVVNESYFPDGVINVSEWNTSLGTNNRPTQPLAGRVVQLHSSPPSSLSSSGNGPSVTLIILIISGCLLVGYIGARLKRTASREVSPQDSSATYETLSA